MGKKEIDKKIKPPQETPAGMVEIKRVRRGEEVYQIFVPKRVIKK